MQISWREYTAHLQGGLLKEVNCEACGTEYLYLLQRTAIGSGTSLYGLDDQGAHDRSLNRAEENLRRMLEESVEPVPCPSCGTYQPDMVIQLRGAYRKWMSAFGALLMVASLVALIVAGLYGTTNERASGTVVLGFAITAGVAFIMGFFLIALRMGTVETYDPNQGDAEPRKKLGQSMAILKDSLPVPEDDRGRA